MPYTTIKSVPDNVKKHKEIPLSLEQANDWASIYDAVKGNKSIDNPAAVAWSTWDKKYEPNKDKTGWVLKEKKVEGAESTTKSYRIMGKLKSSGDVALQTYRLSKDEFTVESARSFCNKHKGYSFAENEGNNFYRCRVVDPEKFEPNSYWTEPLNLNEGSLTLSSKLIKLSEIDSSNNTINAEALMECNIKLEDGRKVKITEKDIDDIIDNFHKNVLGRSVFLDVHHYAEQASIVATPDQLSRYGTIIDVWKGESTNPSTSGKKTLVVKMQLNELGLEAMSKDRYSYLSVAIDPELLDRHTNKKVGSYVLSSIALLNDPAIPFLAPLGTKIPDKIQERLAASRCLAVFENGLYAEELNKQSKERQNMIYLSKVTNKSEIKDKKVLAVIEGVSLDNLNESLREKLEVIEGTEDIFIKDVVFDKNVWYVIYCSSINDKPIARSFTLTPENLLNSLGEKVDVESVWDIKLPSGSPIETPKQELSKNKGEEKPMETEVTKEMLEAKEKEILRLSTQIAEAKERKAKTTLTSLMLALKAPAKNGNILPPAIVNSIEKLVNSRFESGKTSLYLSTKTFLQDTIKPAEGETKPIEEQPEIKDAIDAIVEAEKEPATIDNLKVLIDGVLTSLLVIVKKIQESGMAPTEETKAVSASVKETEPTSFGDKIAKKAKELIDAKDPRLMHGGVMLSGSTLQVKAQDLAVELLTKEGK